MLSIFFDGMNANGNNSIIWMRYTFRRAEAKRAHHCVRIYILVYLSSSAARTIHAKQKGGENTKVIIIDIF